MEAIEADNTLLQATVSTLESSLSGELNRLESLESVNTILQATLSSLERSLYDTVSALESSLSRDRLPAADINDTSHTRKHDTRLKTLSHITSKNFTTNIYLM